MNKSTLLILLLSAVFFSCIKKNQKSTIASTGKINTISIVIDDQLWNGSVGDSLRNKFAAPVEGLSKEEPQFDINQYPINVMEGFVTKSRTIIVVKIGEENHFSIHKNQYATPQNVIHICGKSLSDLIKIIERRTPQIISIIQKGEIVAHQLLLNDSVLNPKTIQKQFQFTVNIPKNYFYILKREKFIWLKKEFISGSNSLLIMQLPVHSINFSGDILKQFVAIHDSIGALYVKGKESNSSLYIDKSYPLYVQHISLDGKVAYEIKGTWRLKNSFMFGSFVNYLIIDAAKERILYLEGFCYVPSSEKRDYRHELESILKGVHLN